jgi:hypothetical protein
MTDKLSPETFSRRLVYDILRATPASQHRGSYDWAWGLFAGVVLALIVGVAFK